MTTIKESSVALTTANTEINKELSDPAIVRALLATTFKDFDEKLMRRAIFEGVMRGFNFKNFLQKDVYAIAYGDGYSLVTSIGYARKIGMRSGVMGKSAPQFEAENGKPTSCTITIKRRVGQDIGEYTATVFFDEYNTDKNQWKMRPRTMLAKVAEMHALRMACPEEMSNMYTEEEFDKNREEAFDRSEIDDDAPVISTGDDISVDQTEIYTEQEIPDDDESLLNMIKAKAIKKWPSVSENARLKRIKDFTGLSIETTNYKTIVKMLS